MRWYAERPVRAAGQLLFDLVAVGWAALGVGIAWTVRDVVLALRAPGQQLVDAGERLRRTFGGAARKSRDVPVFGDDLAGALDNGTDAGRVVSEAGHSQIAAVEWAATGLTVAVIVLALVPLLALWLPRRIRYARAAGAAIAMRRRAPELLALRALTRLPERRILALDEDAVAAWRCGDPDVTARLAGLWLASLGLKPSSARWNRA